MKKMLVLTALLLPNTSLANDIIIYGTRLQINPDCTITSTQRDGEAKVLPTTLPPSSNCRFVNHAETDVPHLERITTDYVVLIEASTDADQRCIAHYTAIIIDQKGRAFPSEVSKTSGTCNIDRERTAFEYLAGKVNKDD